MKVLHIATGKTGGARIAAETLVVAQQNLNGMTSHLIPIGETSQKEKISEYSKMNSFARKNMGRFYTLFQKINTKNTFGILSTLSIDTLNLNNIAKFNPDIIHIHNWFNVMSLNGINDLSSTYPLVFTLHDQRLMTGGCHITHDCMGFKDRCSNCPAIYLGKGLVEKEKKFLNIEFLTRSSYGIISPSRWNIDKFANSTLLKRAVTTKVIPNVLHAEFYREFSNQKERQEIIQILFVASNINEPLKGLRKLVDALEMLLKENIGLRETLVLNIIGNGESPKSAILKINFIGPIENSALAEIMIKMDFCVVPSAVDNFPNTIVECKLKGVFVIGTRTGGIPELISDNLTGFLCEKDVKSISESIAKYLQLNDVKKNEIVSKAKEEALKTHGVSEILSRHNSVYEEVFLSFHK